MTLVPAAALGVAVEAVALPMRAALSKALGALTSEEVPAEALTFVGLLLMAIASHWCPIPAPSGALLESQQKRVLAHSKR